MLLLRFERVEEILVGFFFHRIKDWGEVETEVGIFSRECLWCYGVLVDMQAGGGHTADTQTHTV